MHYNACDHLRKESVPDVHAGIMEEGGRRDRVCGYRSNAKNGPYRKVAAVGRAQSYVDKHLKRGKTYYYKVAALRKVSGKNVKSRASVIKGKRV